VTRSNFHAKLFPLHLLYATPNSTHDPERRRRSSLLRTKQAAAADSTPSGRGAATSYSSRSSLQTQHAEGFRSLMVAAAETEPATSRARPASPPLCSRIHRRRWSWSHRSPPPSCLSYRTACRLSLLRPRLKDAEKITMEQFTMRCPRIWKAR
jgi:hypothetical protein